MNFNNILKSLAAGALMLVGWACTDEVEYTPTPQPAGAQVFFSEDPSSVQIPLNATALPFELERVATKGEVKVPVKASVTDEEGNAVNGIFTFPEEVTFADGEAKAIYNVGVDFAKVVAETDYYFTLTITSTEASAYGVTELRFDASYAPWSDWEPYSESDPLYKADLTVYPFSSQEVVDTVYVCKSFINPDLEKYRFPAYLYSNYYLDFDFLVDKTKTYTIDGRKVYQIIMPQTLTHFKTSSGSLAYLDLYTFLTTYLGYDEKSGQNKVLELGLPSYFDSEKGTFYVAIAAIDVEDPKGGTWGNPSYLMFQLPGFLNYSFVYNLLGNYIDPTGSENAVVQIVRSEDIASYAYEAKQGKLSKEEIAAAQDALAVNPDAELIYDASYNAVVPFTEDGEFTIITVAFDADGNRVYADSYTFEATSVKKESNWVARGVCEYTDGFMNLVGLLYGIEDQKGQPLYIGGQTWDVEYEENKDIPGYYRLVNPYKIWTDKMNLSTWYQKGDYYLNVNCADPEQAYLELSPLGVTVNATQGMILAYSVAGQLIDEGYPASAIGQAGYFGTLDAGELTFPTTKNQAGNVVSTLLLGFENESGFYYADVKFDFNIYFPELDKAPAKRVAKKKESPAFRPGFSVTSAAKVAKPVDVERKALANKSMDNAQARRLFGRKLKPNKF